MLQRRYGEHGMTTLGGRKALGERIAGLLSVAGASPVGVSTKLGAEYLAGRAG